MSIYIRHVSTKITSIISFVALIVFLPLFLLVVQQTVTLLSRATGKSAQIIVDTQIPLEEVNTGFYHAFAQGGEESQDMLASVVSDVRALRPSLIRLDHIYDHYNVVSRNGSELVFDWSRLDAAVSSIIATGAKPVLSLSYMPQAIARDGNIINPPNDWNEWAYVVRRTVEHFSGRTQRNIAGVYYEVWNEPDLEQFGGWSVFGDKSYLTLYRYAATGAQAAENILPFFIGGPSTTGMYPNWITALAESGYRMDFFSWHSYRLDPELYASEQRTLIRTLLPYPNHILLPKLITEFGFTGDKSKGYDTSYAAAHTAAAVRQLLSGSPSYLFSFELKDGPNQADGSGWGLITHDSQGLRKKPRYYVYSFLDEMRGTRLQLSGEGTWVTGFASHTDGIVRVMLINFDPRGNHTETVPVSIRGLAPGAYTVREKFLLGRDTKAERTAGAEGLTFNIYMSSQSVAIIEITPVP